MKKLVIWINSGHTPRSTPAAAPQPPSKAYVDFAKDCLFRPSPSKLGAGYTCSLQAMSCVSRALPDLTARRRKIKAILSKVDVPYAAAYRASMGRAGSGGIAAFTASRRDHKRGDAPAVTPCRCAMYASKKRVEDPPGGFRFLSPRRKEHLTVPNCLEMCTPPCCAVQ